MLIASAERRNELRHRLVTLQSPEAFDGFEDASSDPPTTICPPRHRFTFCFTCRVRLIRLYRIRRQ
jgi:hypothetical protein